LTKKPVDLSSITTLKVSGSVETPTACRGESPN
jgi:hypothetical protein